MENGTSIEDLLEQRMAELGLREVDLVHRMGYRNVSKGLRRVRDVRRGNYTVAKKVIPQLALGLDLPRAEVKQALDHSIRRAIEEDLERERLAFKPHGIYLTERRIPTQIFVCALLGADRKKYVHFPDDLPEAEYLLYALERMPDEIMTFGKVLGVGINYAWDRAVSYDRDGNVLEERDHIWRAGRAVMGLR